MASNNFCGLNNRGEGTYDATGIQAIATALNVNASMKTMNVLFNSIGDEGYEMLMKLAEEKGMLTLVGFDEGQTEADLSNKDLGPIDAKLIARELTTGFVSSSMTSLSLADNKMTRGKLKAGQNPGYDSSYETDMTGIKAIADALSVSSSMNKLNVLSNFIGREGAQALVDAAPQQLQTFCGFEEGQTEANLSGQGSGPGVAVLLAWELTTGYVSSSLTFLNITLNHIGHEGKLALGNAVHESTSSSLGYLTCDKWSVHPETQALDLSGKGVLSHKKAGQLPVTNSFLVLQTFLKFGWQGAFVVLLKQVASNRGYNMHSTPRPSCLSRLPDSGF